MGIRYPSRMITATGCVSERVGPGLTRIDMRKKTKNDSTCTVNKCQGSFPSGDNNVCAIYLGPYHHPSPVNILGYPLLCVSCA